MGQRRSHLSGWPYYRYLAPASAALGEGGGRREEGGGRGEGEGGRRGEETWREWEVGGEREVGRVEEVGRKRKEVAIHKQLLVLGSHAFSSHLISC